MKKEICVLVTFLISFQIVNGQNSGQRKKTQNNAATTQRTSSQNQRKQPTANNLQLDQLDSTLWIKDGNKPGKTNINNRTTNPQTGNRHHQTVSNRASASPKPDWIDSTLWIKNNSKPPETNLNARTTNPPTGNQNLQTGKPNNAPVNQTKLDDLKNPFDSTKKVKASSGAGQLPAANHSGRQRQ